MKNNSPKIHYLADYQSPDFLIDNIDLTFTLSKTHVQVESYMQVRHNPDVHSSVRPLILDGEDIELTSIELDGKTLTSDEYELTSESLLIKQLPQKCTLKIITTFDPSKNTQLMGLYLSGDLLCTQCEADGFRRITYYLDRPDVMTVFTTTIIADKKQFPVLLSNGNRIAAGDLDNGQHWVKWEDPFKKPAYLFALVAGDLACLTDTFVTASGNEVELQIYANNHQIERCHYAIESLKKAMDWDERVYQREYDLATYMIVAVDDFNMGAMENKGLNVFNTVCILADQQTTSDADFIRVEAVIGHEYFHNWTGNRVTCRDWFQLSLKEGLTIFREHNFTADMHSTAVKRIQDVKFLRAEQFPEDASPMAHPVRPSSYIEMNNFYTYTVYEKGSELIRMIQLIIGKELFMQGMTIYFERHDGQAVTIDDFVKAMEDAAQVDFSHFKRWYEQAGTPQVTVERHYNPTEKTYELTLSQQLPKTADNTQKKILTIPCTVALLDDNGQELKLELKHSSNQSLVNNKVLLLTEPKQTFTFTNVPCKPIPSVFRNFSAPVKVQLDYSDAELCFLLQHDNDSFNRWDAGQRFYCRKLLGLVQAQQQQKPMSVDDSLLTVFGKLLTVDSQTDKAFVSLLLSLPNEIYLGELMTVVDPIAIHEAVNFMRYTLAEKYKDSLLSLYQQLNNSTDYELTEESIATRQLKNVCLSYLMQLKTQDVNELCYQQFIKADNMTDSYNALSGLINNDCAQRTEILDKFYQRWQHDTTVLNNWFRVQALSSLPNTLQSVKELLQVPAFSYTNPNKISALIGAFSRQNPVHFHATCGEGYNFLAEQIIKIDKTNSSVAARLVGALTHWRRFDASRQKLMCDQLNKISQQEQLSKNVYEIVAKSLPN